MPVEPKSLPPGCPNCRGASHVPQPNGGFGRCDCARGQALADLERKRKAGLQEAHKRQMIRKVRHGHDGRAAAMGADA